MSNGTQIALALMFMMSGASGYERYMLQGHAGRAAFDAVMLIACAIWLARTLDRVLP